MANTDTFYNYLLAFQDRRKDIMDNYENRLAKLEETRGSRYFDDESKRAAVDRDVALENLKREYGAYFDSSLSAMREANSRRNLTAPREDELRLIQALKMRESVSEMELSMAANSCKNSPLCISIVNEIAKKNGYLKRYRADTNEMAPDDVNNAINSLQSTLRDFMNYDTSRAARIAAQSHQNLYGTSANFQLPKRPLFRDKVGGFAALGISGDMLAGFCAAVDSPV